MLAFLRHAWLTLEVRIDPTSPELYAEHAKYFKPLPPGTKLGVNKSFFRQLRAILMIIIPRCASVTIINES
jgi:hypothetical protein